MKTNRSLLKPNDLRLTSWRKEIRKLEMIKMNDICDENDVFVKLMDLPN